MVQTSTEREQMLIYHLPYSSEKEIVKHKIKIKRPQEVHRSYHKAEALSLQHRQSEFTRIELKFQYKNIQNTTK